MREGLEKIYINKGHATIIIRKLFNLFLKVKFMLVMEDHPNVQSQHHPRTPGCKHADTNEEVETSVTTSKWQLLGSMVVLLLITQTSEQQPNKNGCKI